MTWSLATDSLCKRSFSLLRTQIATSETDITKWFCCTALEPRKYDRRHVYLTLAPTDALFVDIIWTGLEQNEKPQYQGDTMFFPNNGTHPQPGVAQEKKEESRLRSVEYYAESLQRPQAFSGVKINDDGSLSEKDKNRMGLYATKT